MRILFQGDSITDAGRSGLYEHEIGWGYANLVSAELGYKYPNQYAFINRGISGNRISDLIARMQMDIINLKPDVMSILIGVNDAWHVFQDNNGVQTELYEKLYDLLIKEVKNALPMIRILILEPFVLEGMCTEAYYGDLRREVEKRALAAKRIADKHGLEFVPLQSRFDEACKSVPATYWLVDGIHPTPAGHEVIAREWITQFFK